MNLRPILRLCCFLPLAAGLVITADEPPQTTEPAPREIGLVEEATGRLAQVDVTVTGPPELIGSLTSDDFELVVAGRFIEGFLVDRVCAVGPAEVAAAEDSKEPGGAEPGAEPESPAAPTPPVHRPNPVTYLFYFDHHHLKPAGRQNALDTARRLIPDLVRDGSRAMIVSAGETLETFARLTDDNAALLEAVDRIEEDRRQWDPYPYQEDVRVRDVLDRLDRDTTRALILARQYQREERYHTERALRLFSMVMGRLADIAPPKAVIYFADTMRSNAGEHFLSFFGQAQQEHDPQMQALTTAMRIDSFAAGSSFDRVVEEAAALGIRLYTIQAEGLVGASSLVRGTERTSGLNSRGTDDAQNSLVGLALETGGRAFLNGVPAPKIARQIATDLECVYLLSFDPGNLPVDGTLPVVVRVNRPKVRAHTREP